MSENETAEGSTAVLLPPIFDGEAAVELKPILQAAMAAGGIEIDAGQVQRATTQGLQLLAAAAISCGEQGAGFRIAACAPAFSAAAQVLGLTRTLGIDGE